MPTAKRASAAVDKQALELRTAAELSMLRKQWTGLPNVDWDLIAQTAALRAEAALINDKFMIALREGAPPVQLRVLTDHLKNIRTAVNEKEKMLQLAKRNLQNYDTKRDRAAAAAATAGEGTTWGDDLKLN